MSQKIPVPLVLLLGAVVAMGPFSLDMYLPAMPTIQHALGSTAAEVQMTLSAYFAGLALGQLVYGPLSDRIGRRIPLLIGLAIYVLASFGCIFARNIDALIVLRLFQALGGCVGIVISRAVIRDLFPPQDMARVFSALLLVMSVAPILAPISGSMLFAAFGWQSIFVFLTLYGAACWFAVFYRLEESLAQPHPPASILRIAADYLRLLSHRRFMGYALAGGAAQAGMYTYLSSSSFVFIDVFQLTPGHFSMLFGLNACGLIATSQINSFLLRKGYHTEHVLRHALNAFMIAGVLMLICASMKWFGIYGVAVPMFCCLASLGFSFPNVTSAAMAPFGDRAGLASALLGMLQFTIGSVFTWIAGHLYDGTAVPMAAVIACCGILAQLLLRILVRHPKHPLPGH